jgi:glutamine cyclotransferase
MAGILPASDRSGQEDVLNGIAYDVLGDRLFVTGKQWPKLFEIKVVPAHRKNR